MRVPGFRDDASAREGAQPASRRWLRGPWCRQPAGRPRARTWLAGATILALSGAIAAVLAAMSVARGNAEHSFHAFEQTSKDIALQLQLETERNRSLIESTAAFVAINPDATNSEFDQWATTLRWREHYPEVGGFGFVVPVRARELEQFTERMEADPIDPAMRGDAFVVDPPDHRTEYCLAALGQWRPGFRPDLEPGQDYCSGLDGFPLRAIRDTGRTLYYPLRAGEHSVLTITTPVYRGGSIPASQIRRREQFLGWLGLMVDQEQTLARALRNHPNVAATLEFREGASSTAFTSGDAPADPSVVRVDLGNGWSLQTRGVTLSNAPWAHPDALALLATGLLLSLLLGVLVFVLGTGRARARRMVAAKTAELRHQALHDGLTGLPNRDLLVDRTEQILARNRRRGTDGAALFIDLDDFKTINDSLGHEAGDRLLVGVAERLRGALREVDTVGRMGGDEFVILIDGSEIETGPELVAERLLEVLRRPFELTGVSTPLTVTASIGIASGDRERATELLRDADVALHEAKAAGKQRYEAFDREMSSEVAHRIELEFDLRSALDRDEFRLVYQPIYELTELTVVGVEALLRWDHPTAGTISPCEFIPILERTGQIREVGRWVLERACAQMAAWHASGHRLKLSVNLSGRQLDDERVVGDVSQALDRSGLEPGWLVVEVTETALMESPEAATDRLHAIKELGVRIAVDDFGTGYSSLASLQRFPVDCIKIDGEFTRSIATSPESKALIDTLVQLGKKLGLSTLAEGIERPSQLDHLRREQVHEGQGFLFSRPLDPGALEVQVLSPLSPPRSGRASAAG